MTRVATRIGLAASIVAAIIGGVVTVSLTSQNGALASMVAAMATEAPASNVRDIPPTLLAQAAPAQNPAAAPVGTLPGGATSLQETFQDWQVACAAQQGAAKRCVMNQQQVNRQNQQRVLAIELTNSGDKLEGTLLLPFGLALDQGVTLQIDDGAVSSPWRFRTCVPAGCVIALNFDARATATLLKGTVLKIKATADGGGDTPLSVSLKGLGGAYSRMAALNR